jgi:predicted transcriptional regulator
MDMVQKILIVMKAQQDPVTMRHIASQSGIATSTLVGVMMSMIDQGYISEVPNGSNRGFTMQNLSGCTCCNENTQEKRKTSLDRRLFRITVRGEQYIDNWSGK